MSRSVDGRIVSRTLCSNHRSSRWWNLCLLCWRLSLSSMGCRWRRHHSRRRRCMFSKRVPPRHPVPVSIKGMRKVGGGVVADVAANKKMEKKARAPLHKRSGGPELSLGAPAGMAINEDDVHNQISTKMSSESGSDDLWSSLSSFMYNEGRGASQSLMGLSTSLFNDANTFVMDKEDPAEYVPAPAISAADMQLNTQLENVLYVLREVLPGPMVKTGKDNKLLEACSILSDDIRVQDPLVCLEGKDRLWSWLRALATTNVQVHLNEIYAERNRAHPFKGFIHAVWTVVFPEELQSTLKHPFTSSSKCVERSSLPLKLSGQSKLEVDRTGQVMSIESDWYVTKEREEELDSIKLLLTSLLFKEAHN